MKQKCFFLILFLFIFSQSVFSQQAQYGFKDKFYIGILSNGTQQDYSYYNGLNLNLWCHYSDWTAGIDNGWTDLPPAGTDVLTADLNTMEQVVLPVYAKNNMPQYRYRTVGERVKFDKLCYAQRSTYQAEHKALCDPYYDFYSFDNSPDNNIWVHDMQDPPPFGYNQYVKHVWPTPGIQPGTATTILSGLNANREQVNISAWSHGYEICKYHNYIIKPKIRIPTGFDDETQVCEIKVYSWDGSTVIKDVIIKAGYFRDPQTGQYDGSYKEEYFDYVTPHRQIDMTINNLSAGYNLFNPPYQGHPDGHSILEDNCNVDIVVQWFGNCEMWIDYVRVDDDEADLLFKGQRDDWIQQEDDMAAVNNIYNPLKFYIEEFMFSNIPCIGYVNKILMQKSGNKYKMMCDLNVGEYYLVHRKDIWNAPALTSDYVSRTLIDSAGLDEIYTFSYPLPGYLPGVQNLGKFGIASYTLSYIPESLPISGPNSLQTGILAQSTDAGSYDTWLQNTLDISEWPQWNDFTTMMKIANNVSASKSIPFVNLVGVHLDVGAPDANGYRVMGREPTNEELKMLTYLSVSYGAKAELYFWWGGWGTIGDNNGYGRGCTGGNTTYDQNFMRDDNVYGQWQNGSGTSKVGTIGELNTKLNVWGPYLMNFISPTSYIYRLESDRCDMRTNNYINSLATYYLGTPQNCPQDNCTPPPSSPPSPQNMAMDCPDKTYLQVATFWRDIYVRQYPYFMVVNRRCSPAPDGNRDVRILFNPQNIALTGFNNWEIINLYDNSKIKFALSNGWVDLDLFGPGEGRLYSMLPVMVKGGILVGNENLSGDITVQDTVYGNGFNIVVNSNSSLHFTDTSTIVMNGGTFTAGDSTSLAQPNITINAAANNNFHGLQFQGCNVLIFNTSFSNLSNDTTFSINCISCPVINVKNNIFSYSSQQLNGSVNITYFDSSISVPNVYIGENVFNPGVSTLPSVNAMSFASKTVPIIIENNIFNGNQTNGYISIILSGIIGGAIKTNTFTDCDKSISCLSSSLDIAGNSITSSVSGSKSIEGLSGSELRMTRARGYFLGGLNNINNTGDSSSNIYLDGSYFILDQGKTCLI